jgi:hypothetical protein
MIIYITMPPKKDLAVPPVVKAKKNSLAVKPSPAVPAEKPPVKKRAPRAKKTNPESVMAPIRPPTAKAKGGSEQLTFNDPPMAEEAVQTKSKKVRAKKGEAV